MSKARWIELDGNILLVDFRTGYRLKLLIPPRTVYRRRFRGRAARGAVRAPHDVGHVRPVRFSYKLERPIPYMSGFTVLPLPDGVAGCSKALCGVSQAPAFHCPKAG